MEGEIDPDFDPATEKGRANIRQEIDNDEDDTYFKQPDEDVLSWRRRMKKFDKGIKAAIGFLKEKFRSKNPYSRIPEYLEMDDFNRPKDEIDWLLSDPIEEAKAKLVEEYPNFIFDPHDVTFTLEDNKVIIHLRDGRSKNPKWNKPEVLLTKDGKIRARVKKLAGFERLANTIPEREQRLKQAQEIVSLNRELEEAKTNHTADVARLEEKLEEAQEYSGMEAAAAQEYVDRNAASLQQEREEAEHIIRTTTGRIDNNDQQMQALELIERDENRTPEEREAAAEQIQEMATQTQEDVETREVAEQRLGIATKEKIKRALLKYGLPAAFAVAVASTVAAIITALKGVGAGVKKLGTGLKELGKKMAASVPGLLGTVLSLALKTGGELLKFVGNNIWILVVAVGAIMLKKLKL